MTVKVNLFKSDARINISSVFCLIAHLPHADDIANMIDEAKRKAALANDTATNTMNKLDDIEKELKKIHVSPVDTNLSSVLDNVDKSGDLKMSHAHMSILCLFLWYIMTFRVPSKDWLLSSPCSEGLTEHHPITRRQDLRGGEPDIAVLTH